MGAASWQNHDSSPPQSVIILHSNVCLGLSNPYISSALWRQRKSKNTAHYIPILLRGFGEAMVTNDWCIIYSLWCTSHEHFLLSHPKNILTPNTNIARSEQSSHTPGSSHQRLQHFQRKDKIVKDFIILNQVVSEKTWMKNVHMCYIRVTEGKIENLKKEGKMRISTLVFIYTIHFSYLKVHK